MGLSGRPASIIIQNMAIDMNDKQWATLACAMLRQLRETSEWRRNSPPRQRPHGLLPDEQGLGPGLGPFGAKYFRVP